MKAAVYLRQSLDRDGRGVAVERQRQDCLAICEARGWEPHEYVDNSISASTGKTRPAYERMMTAIAEGTIQAVVCWDLDRLHRRPIELEHFIALADKQQIELATATGDVDLSTDNGRLFARIKGSVARAEVERKSARQRRAGLQRAEDGKPWGSHRPFGFEADKATHDVIEAAVIRAMYDDLIAGTSQHEIARQLNERGIRTTMGGEWKQTTVRAVLKNPRNAGLRAYKGEVIGTASWEPVVTEETFRVAQQYMTRAVGSGGPRKYLLVGVAKCGICGAGMVTAYIPGRIRTYACTTGKHVARKADALEELVTETVLRRLEAVPLSRLTIDHAAPKFSELSKETDTLRRRLDSLAVEFADGDLTASQLKAATERLQERIASLESKMSRHGSADVLAPLAGASGIRENWAALDIARQRSIIDLLVNIEVHQVKNRRNPEPEAVRIEWK